MKTDTLTYASRRDPPWKRIAMRAIEDLSGRRRLLPIYHAWRTEIVGKSPRMMGALLDMIGTRLDIAGAWPIAVPPEVPLVIVANHPFGIGDGIALVSLAEALGRPFRILANSDFLKIPEIRHFALPVDFSESRDAIKTKLNDLLNRRSYIRNLVVNVQKELL